MIDRLKSILTNTSTKTRVDLAGASFENTFPCQNESRNFDRIEGAARWRKKFPCEEVGSIDVAVLTLQNYDCNSVIAELQSEVREIIFFGAVRFFRRWLYNRSAGQVFLMVDIDIFEDVEDAVDELLLLRKEEPFLTVIVLSAFFARNDFSDERKALTDCSLKLPTNSSTLRFSLDAARKNSRARIQEKIDDWHRCL